MENFPTAVIVVAAALLRTDGRVLMQRRQKGASHAGLWEFPGGKVMSGETLESALRRELLEELGIEVDLQKLQPLSFASDPDQSSQQREPFLILLYLCRAWSGEPKCLVGEELAWFEPAEILTLPMPPLDIPLADALLRSI